MKMKVNKNKVMFFCAFLVLILVVIVMGYSYAYLKTEIDTEKRVDVIVGTLDYKIESDDLSSGCITVPKNSYKDITISIESLNSVDSKYELYYNFVTELSDDEKQNIQIGYLGDEQINGTIGKNSKVNVNLTIRNNLNKEVILSFGVQGGLPKVEFSLINGLKINKINSIYKEEVLNGTDPVLDGDLIPILIDDDGTVRRASLTEEWYSYENKRWANAIILKDKTINYSENDIIPSSNIMGYFVWIPRYKYEIFNEGYYTNATTVSSKPSESAAQEINIIFESKDVEISTGSTVGTFLTHKAFTTLDVNGIWVGKFESSGSANNITVLPNVASLRSLGVKSIFESAYKYNRNLDSHMMKNTEWGAVTYLSHSKYGINSEIRINNSSTYITGCSATVAALNYYNKSQSDHSEGYYKGCENEYNTPIGYLASTTGNITGIYDMSGGTWEYMAAYIENNYGTSGFNASTIAAYDKKYFDVYPSNSTQLSYGNRILGDATGELGPFYIYKDGDNSNKQHSTWYSDYAYFVTSSYPWFGRGCNYQCGVISGPFVFNAYTGALYSGYITFRLVLSPQV